MRTDGYWLHNGFFCCVSVRCIGKNFHQCVQCGEIDVPSSVVTVEAFDLAPGFCCVLLGIWSKLVEQSVLHDTIVNHDVCGRRSDILDGPLQICDDGLRQKGIVR